MERKDGAGGQDLGSRTEDQTVAIELGRLFIASASGETEVVDAYCVVIEGRQIKVDDGGRAVEDRVVNTRLVPIAPEYRMA